jgi:nitrilase
MRVSVIQMNSGAELEPNLREAEHWIQLAADYGSELAVLPETFACLGVKNQYQLARQRFTENDVLSTIAGWAKQHKLFIIAGSIPLTTDHSEEKVHAASLVFSPEGKIIAQYNKIHLFDVNVADNKGQYRESDTFVAGDKPVTAQILDQVVGLSICYDLRFPELYQHYVSQDCSIMTVPSAFTYATGQQHWEILLRARAIETQSFILAPNQVGVHEDGRETWGQSMIVAPNGEILAQLDSSEPGVITTDLDFELREQIQQAMPLKQHKTL